MLGVNLPLKPILCGYPRYCRGELNSPSHDTGSFPYLRSRLIPPFKIQAHTHVNSINRYLLKMDEWNKKIGNGKNNIGGIIREYQ